MAVANVLAILDAVERAHDAAGLSNPVRCGLPKLALERILKTELPRSWPAASKAEFALLPVDIRRVISEREQQRDTALRRKQNELAEEKKRLLADSADKSVSIIQKEVSNNEHSQA
jgi:hypothetical protein